MQIARGSTALRPQPLRAQLPRWGGCALLPHLQQQRRPLPRQQPPQFYHQQQQHWRQQQPCAAAAGSGQSGSAGQPRPPGWLSAFDRLPPRVQLGVMGGLLFIGMIGLPFLQPTFLYSNDMGTAAKPGGGQRHAITDVRVAGEKHTLPRYIPVASEVYDFLQEHGMPRTLPDGRLESPGWFRIYLCSLIILAVFYTCSAALGAVLRGVAGVLRAMRLLGPPPPAAKPEGA